MSCTEVMPSDEALHKKYEKKNTDVEDCFPANIKMTRKKILTEIPWCKTCIDAKKEN